MYLLFAEWQMEMAFPRDQEEVTNQLMKKKLT